LPQEPSGPFDRPARLKVGLISAGRAGSVVAAALGRAGHQVVAVSAVSDASRGRAEALLPGADICDPHTVAARSDLLVLAVPDDVLPDLVAGLARVRAVGSGTLVAHLSGAHADDVLGPLTQVGALPLALHPAMTFTGTAIDLERLDGCPWAVSAPEPLRAVAEALVVETGGEPEWVPSESRVLYHAALCHAANHLVTLIAQSEEVLALAGVAAPQRFLGPMLSAGLDNALRSGDAALTGPVARGDAGTVAGHVAALRAADAPVAQTYVALARATADRALVDGRLKTEQAQALLDALAVER
jgi:predicted short-subunit dehydrogenase-like oxidoreductase (DUF2520 family)